MSEAINGLRGLPRCSNIHECELASDSDEVAAHHPTLVQLRNTYNMYLRYNFRYTDVYPRCATLKTRSFNFETSTSG